MTDEGETARPRAIVAFRIGEYEFGVHVADMHEVVRYESPRSIPGGPGFVAGVLEVRGALLPLIDLRDRFDVDPGTDERETRVLVVSVQDERVGLVVDSVTDVIRMSRDTDAKSPAEFEGPAEACIIGLVTVDERELHLLGPEAILAEDERRALFGASAEDEKTGKSKTKAKT